MCRENICGNQQPNIPSNNNQQSVNNSHNQTKEQQDKESRCLSS